MNENVYRKVYEEEKKQFSGLKTSREQNEKIIRQHEEQIKNLARYLCSLKSNYKPN